MRPADCKLWLPFPEVVHAIVSGRTPLLADKEHPAVRIQPGALFEPRTDCPQLAASQRLRSRQAALQPGDVKHAAFGVVSSGSLPRRGGAMLGTSAATGCGRGARSGSPW